KSTVFIACKNVEEFEIQKDLLQKRHPHITIGYWPIIRDSYWISPFSPTRELKRLKRELAHIMSSTPILIDLELPLNIRSYIRNIFLFCYHKRLLRQIKELATSRNLNIYYCERASGNKLFLSALRLLGVSFDPKTHDGKILIMYYTSVIEKRSGKKGRRKISGMIRNIARDYPGRLTVGLGTTATGEMGNEPKLSAKSLARDLRFSKKAGIKEVFIFRLGGHDDKYQDVIEEFL
ncbi:MAG: hypothetical protein ACOCZV_02070, partial [Nanoarchaeota archaeon]